MTQRFRPWVNTIARLGLPGLVLVPLLLVSTLIFLRWTDHVTGQNRILDQPVPFSHRHHAAEIGIDCRYCHTGVESQASAGLPPTSTCMTCHSQLWSEEKMLQPVRQSWSEGTRMEWNKVHVLPDYVYFNHSTHVAGGVACTECHGAVGDMRLIGQEKPLTMGWCLSCHRDPGPHLYEASAVFSPFPRQEPSSPAEIHALLARREIDTEALTDCTTCHR